MGFLFLLNQVVSLHVHVVSVCVFCELQDVIFFVFNILEIYVIFLKLFPGVNCFSIMLIASFAVQKFYFFEITSQLLLLTCVEYIVCSE